MTRLPAVRTLAASICSTQRGGQTLAAAAEYLVNHRTELALFEGPEHLALSTDEQFALPGTSDSTIRIAKALGHHIAVLRTGIAKELWGRQIFIDAEVIEELLYYIAREGRSPELVADVLGWIRDARANRPGLLIFPLHSFGVLGAGLLGPSKGRVSFIDAERGYAITPQTNSLDRTLEFLDDARACFGIGQRLPVELLSHWRRSRPTAWLESNPLLVVRTVHLPASYYGSEWLLLSRIRATTGLLAMLAAMQPEREDRWPRLFSSRNMNNWQTLDIHHYISLFAGFRRSPQLRGQCIPIHAGRIFVSELSDLAIDIDPAYWHRRQAFVQRVHDAVEGVYAGYLRAQFARKPDARERTVRKVFESISYFRRSFQGSPSSWSGKVALAMAFELLLLDGNPDTRRTLVRRTRLLLRGTAGTRSMQAAVDDLYGARNALVHRGDDSAHVDIPLAREAYVRCFVEVAPRISMVDSLSATPLGDAIGDH